MAEEEGEDQAYITAKDFMNDFATEEFLSKNIRVRPLSGVTRLDEDGRTNDYQRSMNDQGQPGDGDAEFNEMRVIEMEEIRRDTKEKRRQYLIKKAIEEEKAKKNKRWLGDWCSIYLKWTGIKRTEQYSLILIFRKINI